MPYGDIGTVIETLQYEATRAYFTKASRAYDHIGIVLFGDTNRDRKFVTVEVDDAGNITDTVKDTLIDDTNYASYFDVAERAPGILVFTGRSYHDAVANVFTIVSISVDDEGGLPGAVLDMLTEDVVCKDQTSVIHLTGNIMVSVYENDGGYLVLQTFECDASGILSNTFNDTYNPEDHLGRQPDIIRISSSKVAVAMGGAGAVGYIKTYSIDALGNITTPEIDSLTFSDQTVYYPRIVRGLGDIYSVWIRDGNDDGWVYTCEIDSDGNFVGGILDSYEFEPTEATGGEVIHMRDGYFAVVYSDSASHGVIKTLYIDGDGNITTPFLDSYEFEGAVSYYPDIALMSGDILLIFNMLSDESGEVHSLSIDLPPVGRPHHEMMMKMGP